MPRDTKRTTTTEPKGSKVKKSTKSKQLEDCTEVNSVVNVNSNHATDSNASHKDGLHATKRNKIKSKVLVANSANTPKMQTIQFEEEGNTVMMEINENSANEFTSEDEAETETQIRSSDSESDVSDREMASDQEEGELTEGPHNPSDTEEYSDSTTPQLTLKSAKRLRKEACRQSFEARLDMMSNTLLAVQELLVNSGIASGAVGNTPKTSHKDDQAKQKSGKERQDGGKQTVTSTSETTVYDNALEKIEVTQRVVDPEISFKITGKDKQCGKSEGKRDSSSSEERIDMSDEMMEIDLDLNDKFIADCQAEAENNKKKAFARDDTEDDDPRRDAKNMICQAEANKIRMLGTSGSKFGKFDDSNQMHFNGASVIQHSSLEDENYIVVGANVDNHLCEKIKWGEYVDFSEL